MSSSSSTPRSSTPATTGTATPSSYLSSQINKSSTMDSPTDLAKPRILCLHGGGVNSEVFRLQCRSLIKHMGTDFRFVFADGPWFCDPGPGIVPVYQDYGPFRRWLRWLPDQPCLDDEAATEEIFYELERCKCEDDQRGATGEWVGLLGFSQGAKLAASLLYDQQIRREKFGHDTTAAGSASTTNYRFAVLLAGRNPLVSFGEYSRSPALVPAGGLSEGFEYDRQSPHILRLPTLHVHGLGDAGLHLHRRLREQYCDPDTSEVVEWDGDHRVPIKWKDVQPIKEWVDKIARKEGLL
ncbi:Putative serine hydrolase FSH, alpha/Beta hydrolase [Septoria linicola]|uniref:Serine hydrolase FSH, alpha/Beta hydrolase n=1 Tax=Septoria linicola TaxID=215465 RepID=A0A9Q9ER50_9PEZI|nr:putative serine hydrolase FSH, alpha/Beta hydrolase [Septoria linicola]USW59519.1 Putative serine hydrolase FSH, alpha/Beta hydrolase [Septoria linicola]